jgi:hypothetical protein
MSRAAISGKGAREGRQGARDLQKSRAPALRTVRRAGVADDVGLSPRGRALLLPPMSATRLRRTQARTLSLIVVAGELHQHQARPRRRPNLSRQPPSWHRVGAASLALSRGHSCAATETHAGKVTASTSETAPQATPSSATTSTQPCGASELGVLCAIAFGSVVGPPPSPDRPQRSLRPRLLGTR